MGLWLWVRVFYVYLTGSGIFRVQQQTPMATKAFHFYYQKKLPASVGDYFYYHTFQTFGWWWCPSRISIRPFIFQLMPIFMLMIPSCTPGLLQVTFYFQLPSDHPVEFTACWKSVKTKCVLLTVVQTTDIPSPIHDPNGDLTDTVQHIQKNKGWHSV